MCYEVRRTQGTGQWWAVAAGRHEGEEDENEEEEEEKGEMGQNVVLIEILCRLCS